MEICCSSRALWQAGHAGVFPLRTSASNCSPQSRHLKSKIGTAGILRSTLALLESHGMDGRQVGRERLPGIAAVLAKPKRTGGGSEREAIAGLVNVECVAVNQIVSVLLRQTVRQCFERPATVAGAVDHHAAVLGI